MRKLLSLVFILCLLIQSTCPAFARSTVSEDAAAVSGDDGEIPLSVRRDTPATSAGTDGDYATLNTDANGYLYTTVGPIGVAAGSLGKAEDAAHTSADTGVAILSRRVDTAASSAGTTGDYATLNTDANGLLYTNSKITAQDIEANGNSLYTNIALAGTKVEVSDSPALIKSITFTQLNDEVDYILLYDLDADDVTVGTTAATQTIVVPIGTATFNPVHTIDFGEPGIAFNTGFTIAAGETSDGMTAPDTAFGVVIEYK